MSKKGSIEVFQSKISRNDRFAQMSHQEKLIEQKKKEIKAKLEQKQIAASVDKGSGSTSKSSTKTATKTQEKKLQSFNTFSNDGSFLNQFKQMKEKKVEHRSKSFKARDNQDRFSDDRTKHKWKRDNSSKDNGPKVRVSRFSDKPPNFEPKININTSYSNLLLQQSFDNQNGLVTAQNVTGQPLLKNLITPHNVNYPLSPQNNPSVIAAPPLLLNVPPPQLQIQNSLILPSVSIDVDLCPTSVITTVTIPTQTTILQTSHSEGLINIPPPCLSSLSTMELANIPAPNPIQVHNIPQPEPINTLTIPPPAPIQVQNIPPPSPIQLIEIPNPKPLDILSIPTPNDTDNLTDPDFIKNVPPPNKSIPPPNLPTETNLNINIPPPANQSSVPTCLPPPNVMPPTSIPPPPQTISQTTSYNQNLLIPPPQTITLVPPPQSNLIVQTMQNQSLAISLPMTIQLPQNSIPSLMAQAIMPPPNLGIVPPPITLNCPPLMMQNPPPTIQVPPPGFINQQNQMVSMNLPPPTTSSLRDLNEVFPPGTADYEAMASLGRMVAQCGPGIEDVVRKRNKQDPSLWFLFHKESSAYQQYLQIVNQFKAEIVLDGNKDCKPEDIYQPEAPSEDDVCWDLRDERIELDRRCGRKRKSRWGNQDETVETSGNVVLSKITRSDQALLQYALTQFGSTNLSEEDWKKAEDHYKINVLYQDMLKRRQEVERLQQRGQNKYDYDSDEDIDGGTWEHKIREKEMIATQLWSTELNRQAEGKHHIGDFLPPEEFKKFMEKSQAVKEGKQVDVSDYEEFKLTEDNVGFKLLQKLGWSEGTGLGTDGTGILEPVNKGLVRDTNQGLGLDRPDGADVNDDEYDAYRKRMMLAYRFRPNPLNNPRRPYY